MKIALKEMRETNIYLKIIDKLHWFEQGTLTGVRTECNELVSIFVKSISTAEKTDKRESQNKNRTKPAAFRIQFDFQCSLFDIKRI